MKLNLSFIRQHYTGKYIGGFIDTYQRSVGILGSIQYVAIIIVLYTTSARPFFDTYLPWMTFTIYILITFVLAIGIMAGAYIIGAPSSFAYWNHQIWKHENPQRTKLEKIERNQRLIMKKLGIEDVG